MRASPLPELESVTKRTGLVVSRTRRDRARPPAPDVKIWRDTRGIVCAFGYTSGGYGWMELPGVATFRFESVNSRVTAYPAPSADLELVHDSYCHAALPLALHYFGSEVLHASAVLAPGGVVAFCAISETGKSTLAAALSLRGYPLWADDAVALSKRGGDGAMGAIPIPFRPRLRAPAAAYLKYTGNRGAPTPALLRESGWTPLAALCVLRRSEAARDGVEISRLSPPQAFGALLPHAFCFTLKDPQRKRLMLRTYLDLAAHTPAFAVSFVPEFEKLPTVLDAIEDKVPAFEFQDGSIGQSVSG